MRWSTLFIPTLREHPAEAEVISHQLLLRAGYIRQLSAGIYNYLLLAHRSLLRIQQIVREEMNAIGGQEILLAALNPAEVWQESGRWNAMGDNMFRLKDRFGRDLCLGMTHEEVVTFIARGELRSYKQLPQIWYQIQTKFRDEPRPKSGFLRVRQFIMKDSYTFDLNPDGLDLAYQKHYDAYRRIFDRCGLEYMIVEAHSGAMGGSQSHEFMVRSDAGEDFVVTCRSCAYAANLEKAASHPSRPAADPEGDFEPEEFYTPNLKTIADLSAFTKLPESAQMKSLVMIADGVPVLAMLRGDHQLSETKLQVLLQAKELRPAHPHEIVDLFGASAGSLGPVGVKNMRTLADLALQGRRNMICGANRDDYHLRNVTPGEDFEPEYLDLRQVASGDVCVNCGGTLEVVKAIEIGHIFKLGYKYSESMGLRVLGEDGTEVTPIMGSYGIGIERILTCAIELFNDKDGMILPPPIAPFAVVITPVNYRDALQREAADLLYTECRKAGIDALLDDRDERPGVKFKDADLIGIPYRITVGKKLSEAKVEFRSRRSRVSQDVRLHEAIDHLEQQLSGGGSGLGMRCPRILLILFILTSLELWGSAPEAPVVPAAARPSAHFDVETATNAWLATVPPASKARSDSYFEGGYWLILWDFLYLIAVMIFLLETRWSAKLRTIAERITCFRLLQTFLYWIEFLVVTSVLMFPLTVYEGYFREHRYALSNQAFGSWFRDQIVGLAIGLVLGGIAFVIVMAIVRRLARSWHWWGAVVGIAFFAFSAMIAPVFLFPLFNKFTPLPDSSLKREILNLARANGIPAKEVYEVNASRQSKRVSANVSGFLGTERISLNDNLLNRCSPQAVLSVMGHEMGHYVMHHILNAMLFAAIALTIMFGVLRCGLDRCLRWRGERWQVRSVGDTAVLPLAVLILAAFSFATTPVDNSFTRMQEYEADIFGLNAARQPDGEAEVDLLLGEYRKLSPGPLEEMLFFDHPSGRTRIHAAMRWKAENLCLFDAKLACAAGPR